MYRGKKLRCFSLLFAVTLVFSLLVVTPTVSRANSTTYYMDSINGNDDNNGTSESSAYRTLEKLNSIVFGPGDQILFKAGGIWSGAFLPQGSGAEGAPIIVDKYGDGERPIINGNGVPSTIKLYNQEYWEFHNLEVTNSSTEKMLRQGFFIEADNLTDTVLSHIYINNCYIHDVVSRAPNYYWGDPWEMGQYSGGILTRLHYHTNVNSHWDDIRYTNNTIENVDKVGMKFAGGNDYATNVVVTDNYFKDCHGDGVNLQNQIGTYFARNTIINSKWNVSSAIPGVGASTWRCHDAVLELNSIHDTHNTADGQAFDFDGHSYGNTLQYNYTSNNDGGFFIACAASGYPSDDGVVRYNISQNDKDCLLQFRTHSHRTKVYNNTFYTKAGMTGPTFLEKTSNQGDAEIYNNIWVNLGTANHGPWENERITYSNNLFYGNFNNYPNDSNLITADPKLVNPNTGTHDWDSVDGYMLQETSPAINAGKVIADNGGRDYWGNTVYYNEPDIGAHEFQGEPVIVPTDPGKQVDLTSYFNDDGFSYDTDRGDGDLDGHGYTYSADLVASTMTYDGVDYQFGSFEDGQNNVIDCDGQTIDMEDDTATSIYLLGSSTNGNKSGDVRINYTDGTYTDVAVEMKDWCKNIGVAVLTMDHRHKDTGDSTTNNYIYRYTLTPEAGKTVDSLTLPSDDGMHIYGISYIGSTVSGTVNVDLTAYFNRDGFTYDAGRTDGNYDDSGYTYSADLVSSSLVHNEISYTLGSFADGDLNVVDCEGQTIAVPSGEYSAIHILTSAVKGNKSGTFRVSYEDGTYGDTTLSVGDWCAGSGTVVATMGHRHSQTADAQQVNKIYVYSLDVVASKTVSEIVLPDEEYIRVLGISLVE